jgi:hypothetical protein
MRIKTKPFFSGYLDNDGELKAAVLQFLSIKGSFISAIIKAGTDNFPSFDKKLSELNLEVKAVDNITDAIAVISKDIPRQTITSRWFIRTNTILLIKSGMDLKNNK